eukprot:Nitzschia sp. Nitz4//scaffold92_size79448//42936//43166//NITZ4_005393-RA/size79448-exonerate_protein2genome-gene-0.5-mRNA-1//1//CDS//3329560192//4781//frame0
MRSRGQRMNHVNMPSIKTASCSGWQRRVNLDVHVVGTSFVKLQMFHQIPRILRFVLAVVLYETDIIFDLYVHETKR